MHHSSRARGTVLSLQTSLSLTENMKVKVAIELYYIFSKISKFNFKESRSVTMNIFRKKSFLFKSFVKIELSYVFTINMFSAAEKCMEK